MPGDKHQGGEGSTPPPMSRLRTPAPLQQRPSLGTLTMAFDTGHDPLDNTKTCKDSIPNARKKIKIKNKNGLVAATVPALNYSKFFIHFIH